MLFSRLLHRRPAALKDTKFIFECHRDAGNGGSPEGSHTTILSDRKHTERVTLEIGPRRPVATVIDSRLVESIWEKEKTKNAENLEFRFE